MSRPSSLLRFGVGFLLAARMPLDVWRARKLPTGPGAREKLAGELSAEIAKAITGGPNAHLVPAEQREALLRNLKDLSDAAREADQDDRRGAEQLLAMLSAHPAGLPIALAVPVLPGLLLWALSGARVPLFLALLLGYAALCAALSLYACLQDPGEDDDDEDLEDEDWRGP